MLSKQSQSHVKQNNLRLVLNTLIKKQQLSRADIVRLTQISNPTVSSLIDELIKRNIIREIGVGEAKRGRKPLLLEFNKTRKYFIAIDLGRIEYTVAISDLIGNIIKKHMEEFNREQNLFNRLDVIIQTIMSLLDELEIGLERILKIICSIATVYTEKNKKMKLVPSNVKSNAYDIKAILKNELKREVILKHSTKLSLLGEKVRGAAKGYHSAVYVDFAYGLGCSFMIKDIVYFDPNDTSGEFGYFYSSIDEFNNTRIMPFELGSLEKRISGKAIREKGTRSIISTKYSKILELANGDINNVNGKVVFKAAQLGDPIAYSILKESFNYFNMALCNVINLIGPEIVILGGGFARVGDYLITFIEDDIKDKVLIMPKLVLSDLEEDAGIIGGIHYLINHTDFLSET